MGGLLLAVLLLTAGAAAAAAAPQAPSGTPAPTGPVLGGVPTGERSPQPVVLTIADAVARALRANLAVRLQQQTVREAEADRAMALSDLLPRISGGVSLTRQQTNLDAFGFTGFRNFSIPPIVGPFNVFDARVSLSQSIVNLSEHHDLRAERANVRAEASTMRAARTMAAVVAAGLYLQAATAESRIQSVQAQVDSAEALYVLARDLKDAGVSAGIDVLRADVQRQSRRQELIVVRNEFEKLEMQLVRAIGLPVGQAITLADTIEYTPGPALTLDAALDRAYASRPDYQAARARVEEAEAAHRSATFERAPSLDFAANYGTIGQTAAGAHPTFLLGASVNVPVFEGGRLQARALETDARLEARRAELADERARIEYEVRAALLDLRAADERVQVARSAQALAREELEQARDRFAAGVVGNIEVVQAQEAVAVASERYIASLYAHNVAKIAAAAALGVAEDSITTFFGGSLP